MRFSHAFMVAAAAFLVRAAPTADTEECEADEVVSTRQTSTTEASVVAAVNTTLSSTTTSTASNTTTIFTPVLDPAVNVHDVTNVVPITNVTLLYASNDTTAADAGLNVTHTMKEGTVLLENIGAIINVTCSSSSVVVSFSNSTVFEAAEAAWSALGNLVLITNHFGECDPTLERGFFSVSSLESDANSLAITCSSSKSDVAGTAAVTEVAFGGLSGTALSKRTTLSSDYTLDFTQALADDTVLYSYSPYVEVTADSASVSAAVTFSGYLKYNWLTFSLNDLYFDIDTDFSADLALSVDVESSYDNTFTYAPSTLEYSLVSVPGILELGPALNFEIGAEISASEAVDVTTEVGMALADGNVHIDLLDESNTSTSGWTPTYTASVNISGQAAAEVNPFVVLTVEIEIKILGGLIDLSTGLTAKPGFNNTIVLTAAEGVDLTGVTGTTSNGSCSEGLALDSEFFFVLDAFATEWYSTELYSVAVPIADECYSWE